MAALDWAVLSASAVAVLGMALRIIALGVIPGNRKPSTGMAWLLLILTAPLTGFAIFLLFGRTSLGRRRHARQSAAIDAIRDRTADLEAYDVSGLPAYASGVAALNHRLAALPLQPGHSVTLLPDYRGSIEAMAAAVREAETFVHVEFYITAWDDVTAPLLEAMTEAAARGVRVKLLFDHLGSRGIPGYRDLLKRLDATTIDYRVMLPIRPLQRRWRRPDLRNHRKLVVVDGAVAFMGSQNLTEPGYNKPKNHAAGRGWVELMARFEGPVVASINAVFASDWYTETEAVPDLADPPAGAGEVGCQLVPSGPGYTSENNLRMFTSLVYGATRRLSITSPYFVPDESLLYAVTTAAQRGVAVELFVSEESDQFMVGHAQASYYRSLLEAGVRIWLYPAPAILHSKHLSVDDDVAVIGSSNLDLRSFALNYEISMMLLGGDVVARMREVEDHYRTVSRELTLEEWSQRPRRSRYVDNVMRLTAALQ